MSALWGTTYRFYVNAEDATDKFSAVFGNDQAPLVINTPEGIYNNAFNTSWNASGINEALFGFFPDLEFDSYATIPDLTALQLVSLGPTTLRWSKMHWRPRSAAISLQGEPASM